MDTFGIKCVVILTLVLQLAKWSDGNSHWVVTEEGKIQAQVIVIISYWFYVICCTTFKYSQDYNTKKDYNYFNTSKYVSKLLG